MDGGEVGKDRSQLATTPIFIFSLSGFSQDVSLKFAACTPDEGSPLLAVMGGDLLLLCSGERYHG